MSKRKCEASPRYECQNEVAAEADGNFSGNINCEPEEQCKYARSNRDTCEKEYVFCRDFRRGLCTKVGCKSIHRSAKDEDYNDKTTGSRDEYERHLPEKKTRKTDSGGIVGVSEATPYPINHQDYSRRSERCQIRNRIPPRKHETQQQSPVWQAELIKAAARCLERANIIAKKVSELSESTRVLLAEKDRLMEEGYEDCSCRSENCQIQNHIPPRKNKTQRRSRVQRTEPGVAAALFQDEADIEARILEVSETTRVLLAENALLMEECRQMLRATVEEISKSRPV